MNEKEKLDSLKFLSETHRREFNERRKYEWKIVLTTLSFYALTVAAVFNKDSTIRNVFQNCLFLKIPLCIGVLYLFLILAATCSFLVWKIYEANNVNKKIAEGAERVIDSEGQLNIISALQSGNQLIHPIKRWSNLCQIVTLFVFAIVAALLVIGVIVS